MNAFDKNLVTHDPSSTEAFEALTDVAYANGRDKRLKAVVIGGGTGAPVSIRTLLSMGFETSAVVAMADDGGSTGDLREELGVLAPGDIRKCLTAMAADANDPKTQAFKMRFSFAENHTLGNLMLSALELTSGSFPYAVAACEEILGARGHVYCSTLDRVTLIAQTVEGDVIEGQARASHSDVPLRSVKLRCQTPIRAYQPAIDAIRQADVIVLGPGSLYTSIIPNIIVPDIATAIRESSARVLFVCSLADMQGETRGMNALDHYRALCRHGLRGAIDAMIVHAAASEPVYVKDTLIRPVYLSDAHIREIESAGTRVFELDLADEKSPTWHDPRKLQHAFAEVISACRSPRM